MQFSKAPDSAELCKKFGKNLEVSRESQIQKFVDSAGLKHGAARKASLCRSAGNWFLEHENPEKAKNFLSQSVDIYKDLKKGQNGIQELSDVQVLLALAWIRNYERIQEAEEVLMDVLDICASYDMETAPLKVVYDQSS